MASNASDSQSLGKNVKTGQLTCPLCTNQFKEPKILDCLHSFCLECLQKLSLNQEDSTTAIKCPTCGRKTSTTGIEDLCANLSLCVLVEEAQIQEQLQGQGSEIKCQSCDEDNPATCRCMDCGHFLCRECQTAHQRMTVMKSHKIYTLAQFKSGEVVYKSELRDRTPKCKVHTEQDLNLYCNTCERLVCQACSALEHGSQGHALTSPAEAVKKCKQDVAELLAKAEKTKTALSEARKETIKSQEELDSNFDEIRRRISQKADEEIARVRQQEHRLKEEAERIYNDAIFLTSLKFNPHKNQRH
ncbi:E3 ubiquitin-protein ligase TRIM56-like [Patiria miniata]|uniref:Uncharacterized protein n=1 Tax=Patiria miniata TaxID=46514 RepID=A0A914B1G5_PATMI|nr:E3 ubiquitin-protein ligase TRIM56-like [Patiria miniata]